MIRFHELHTSLASRVEAHRSVQLVRGVEILSVGKDARILILCDLEKVEFSHEYLPGVRHRPGGYRLVLDFRAPEEGKTRKDTSFDESLKTEKVEGRALEAFSGPALPLGGTPVEKVDPVEKDAEQVSGSTRTSAKPEQEFLACLKERGALSPESRHGEGARAFNECRDNVAGDEQWHLRTAYLFAQAYYQHNEERLLEVGAEVLAAFSRALNAGILEEKTPTALFYSGRTCMVMGDWRRAEMHFMRLVEDYSQHHLAGRTWLKLAQIYASARSYLESVQAARRAQEHPLTQWQKAEAFCFVGKGLYMLGDSEGAAENTEKCLQKEPSYYLREPQLLRELGESHFSLGNHQESNDRLLHYLNVSGAVPDTDLVLARVAENFTFLGETSLAERLRNHVAIEYPHTEGAVIVQLRVAEAYETEEPAQPLLARAIYEELLQKGPNQQLRGLLKLKLAAWHWKHGSLHESLHIIQEALATGDAGNAAGEFIRVKEKVLEKLIGEAFVHENHREVVALYAENSSTVKGLGSPDLIRRVAESHGALGLYGEAIALHEELVANEQACDESFLRLAQYNFLTGQVQKAETYLSRVGSGWAAEKNKLLGQIAGAGGDHSKAVTFLSRVLRDVSAATQDDLDWIALYVDSLLRVDRPWEAVKWVDGALGIADEQEMVVRLSLLRVGALEQLKRWHEAAATLETVLALPMGKTQRSTLTYRLSGIYQQAGMEDRALERLAQLSESSDPFWQSVARQQLDYIGLKKEGLLEF